MNPAFSLKGFTSLNQFSHSMNLERNLAMFFDYGCMGISGYQNIYYNTTQNGYPLGKLKPADSEQYARGRVWEGYRTNWAWEADSNLSSGISGIISITGVYVNGGFTGSGFNVDYKKGQIIFDSGISTTATVKASFSAKSIYWDTADSTWWKELVTETYNYQAFDNAGIGSGIRSVMNNHRIPLPAVIIEVTTTNNFKPYQLGGGSWYNPTVNFYIYAENPDQKKLITDLICSQNDHSFLGVDFNSMSAANDRPFTPYGFLASGAKTFAELQPLYSWNVKPITFENLNGLDIPFAPPVYRGLVRGNMNLVLNYI